ncbi:restriction endonuclease subunit S [Herbaspirillum sp. C7C8]|uniref:restriction endonuclease subunit S n=1 Tax=Herbaspirillum sp. C7C8 TaxID=2736665 RepID=UPI001F527EE7|nr:restriction endonuclease subunit S [Herbaspirillum sp. C7C8]MCI1006487.1 restriction endonuclease subunit S [Herbaspirillum sp. C7C8]
MPKDWRTFQLSELMTFRNGLNYTVSDAGEAIKIVGVADFQARDVLNDTAALQVVRVKGRVSDTDLLKSGDLLFVRSNGNKALIGRCLYFPAVTDRLAFSGFTIRGRADPAKLAPDFAAYLLRAPHVAAQMQLGGAGTNISNLSQEILNRVQIEIPGLDEQSHITKFIKVWDLAISASEKLLTASRRQRDALSDRLLGGGQRLLGHTQNKKGYRLGELFDERVEADRPDLPLLSITREQGVIPRDDVGRKDTSNEDKSKYLRVCPGDIAYNTMRMWQGVSALSAHEGIVSPAYTVVRPKTHLIDAQFAAYLFKYRPVVFLFYRYSQGLVSDTWNLKFHHFREIHVEIPALSEQVAIVNVLKAADEEIAALEKQLDHLREEKRALMADLLTGKRRVRMPDTTAEPEAA